MVVVLVSNTIQDVEVVPKSSVSALCFNNNYNVKM